VMYYPLNVGRNMEEIMRVLEAMQTADANGCAMPLNWKKGEKVIVPPPKTLKDLDARLNEKGIELIDFYLAKKELRSA
jgi:peroxiredoxin 2/4